jgi:hypothetical protein
MIRPLFVACLLIATPAAAEQTPPTPPVSPPTSSLGRTMADVPTTPPEKISPKAILDTAGPAKSAPFSAGPQSLGSGLSGSDQVNPQFGTGPSNPEQPTLQK